MTQQAAQTFCQSQDLTIYIIDDRRRLFWLTPGMESAKLSYGLPNESWTEVTPAEFATEIKQRKQNQNTNTEGDSKMNHMPNQVTRREWEQALDTAVTESIADPYTLKQVMTGMSLYMYSFASKDGLATVLIFKDTYRDEFNWCVQTVTHSKTDAPQYHLGDEWLARFPTRTDAVNAVIEVPFGVDTKDYEFSRWGGIVHDDVGVLITEISDPEGEMRHDYRLYTVNLETGKIHTESLGSDALISRRADSVYAVWWLDDKRLGYVTVSESGDLIIDQGYVETVPFVVLEALRRERGFKGVN